MSARTTRAAALFFAALSMNACGSCGEEGAPHDDSIADAAPDAAVPDAAPDAAPSDGGTSGDLGQSDAGFGGFDFGDEDGTDGPLALSSIEPDRGPTTGGTPITIRGVGVGAETIVTIAGVVVDGDGTTGVFFGVTPPSRGAGPVTVKAANPGRERAAIVDGFTYIEPLTIESTTPSAVPTGGGVEIEVRGSGFGDRTAFSFGARPAARAIVLSDSLARLVAPPGPAGLADLRVVTPDEASEAIGAITYYEPVRIDEIAPATGPSAGGNEVTLTGAGLTSATRVRFGSTEARALDFDPIDGALTVEAPPGPPGPIDLTIIGPYDAARIARGYVWGKDGASPLIARLHPSMGPSAGGNEVTLYGRGLDNSALTVRFADQSAPILARSDDRLVVRAPAGPPGPAGVIVERDAEPIASLAGDYEWLAPLSIDSISPAQGEASGGTEIEIRGAGLAGTTDLRVGGAVAPIIARGADSIVALTPAGAPGPVNVRVERGGAAAEAAGAFRYLGAPEIWGFGPRRGASSGNTLVEVRGIGFGPDLVARIGGVRSPSITLHSPNRLTLRTPPGAPGPTPLSIEDPSGLRATADAPFTYFDPTVAGGGVAGAPIEGAVNVSVFGGGVPIEGAFVMLSTRAATRYQGRTDRSGQIVLSGEDVLGAQTVTAIAPGFSAVSIQTVDAENITIVLESTTPPSPSGGGSGGGGGAPPPSPPRITGRLSFPSKLADPSNPATRDFALVATTRASPFSRNPAPGPGGELVGPGRYAITSRAGEVAVVALCGVWDTEEARFEARFLGLARSITARAGERVSADLSCDIPLDRRMTIKLTNPAYAPDGPNQNIARVIWALGSEGYFPSPSEARGLADTLVVERQPAPTGSLAGLEYLVRAGSFTGALGAPYTLVDAPAQASIDRPVAPPALLDVPFLVEPSPGATLFGGSLIRWTASGPYPPDATLATIVSEDGFIVWRAVVPGSARSVRLPTFPDFSALPRPERPNPYPPGAYTLTLDAFRLPGFRYDRFTYDDLLGDGWTARATTSLPIRF